MDAVLVDSARATMTVSAIGMRTESVERGQTFDETEVETLAIERAREAAEDAGAAPEDDTPVEILRRRQFNVVERNRVVGQVVDATAQVEPGLRRGFGGRS